MRAGGRSSEQTVEVIGLELGEFAGDKCRVGSRLARSGPPAE